jgi:hypothetical protein
MKTTLVFSSGVSIEKNHMVSGPENREAIQSGDEVLSHGPQIALGDDLLPLSFGGLAGLHLEPTKASERLYVVA